MSERCICDDYDLRGLTYEAVHAEALAAKDAQITALRSALSNARPWVDAVPAGSWEDTKTGIPKIKEDILSEIDAALEKSGGRIERD